MVNWCPLPYILIQLRLFLKCGLGCMRRLVEWTPERSREESQETEAGQLSNRSVCHPVANPVPIRQVAYARPECNIENTYL
jgi:hypothetical protein